MTHWTETASIQPAEAPAPGYPDTWYSRTLSADITFPTLEGDQQAETVVIGAGLAGINTALGLAERGKSVILLESDRVGFGASGRNGGFVTPGFARDFDSIAKRVGLETASELYGLSTDAVATLRARIDRFDIDCGPIIDGTIDASWFHDEADMEADAAEDDSVTYWDGETVRANLGTTRYHSAHFEDGGFQLHPLNLTRGLAQAAQSLGAYVHEETPVISVQRGADHRYRVATETGTITAENVVFCMSGYRPFLGGGSGGKAAASILPITTFVMVTEPLGDLARQAISIPQGISDTRFACDYYRPLPDTGGRILWGGRISTFRPRPAGVADLMKRDMTRVYPVLKDAKVDFAWLGLMGYAFHKMPIIQPLAPGLWSCTGFGGHGLNTTLMGGELVASAIADGDDRFRLLDAFSPIPMPRLGGLVGAQATYWWYEWKEEIRIALGR